MSTAIALTIAGSDSGGGAGIQADIKTFSALGAYATSVIVALTAQNTQAVTRIEPVSQAMITAQIEAVFADLPPQALKTGMLGDAQTITTVATQLRQLNANNLVIDPVMVAKSGDKLLADNAVNALRDELVPLATIITPNIPEAEVLLGTTINSQADMEDAAKALLALGCQAVLLKGGHGHSTDSSDLLLSQTTRHWLKSPRIDTRNTHGTGCTLSAAITAGLAKGLPLTPAVEQAKDYISQAITQADSLNIGSGHGPVHHFHRWWS